MTTAQLTVTTRALIKSYQMVRRCVSGKELNVKSGHVVNAKIGEW